MPHTPRRRATFPLVLAALTISMAIPATASADALKAWVAGRGNYFTGESDLFLEFDRPVGVGLEAGVEVVGFTAFVEAMSMFPEDGALPDRWLFTGNLGIDLTFGEDVRFHLGGYTGPILFLFPKGDPPPAVDFSQLSPETRQAIEASGEFGDLDEAEAEFNELAAGQEDLSRLAFGWNLGRLRAAIDVPFGGIFAIGVAGQVGYHYLISGEQAAAGAKNEVISTYADQYQLPEQVVDELRAVVGAEEVNLDELNGVNYDVNLYLRLEFSTGRL